MLKVFTVVGCLVVTGIVVVLILAAMKPVPGVAQRRDQGAG